LVFSAMGVADEAAIAQRYMPSHGEVYALLL
jgi:hypothetical protein